MTAQGGQLAALAAVFAGERAPALLARVSGAGAAEAAQDGGRLASASREDRLRALAAAMCEVDGSSRAAAEAAAAHERPRVAALLRALGAGSPALPADAALVRLCRERVGR